METYKEKWYSYSYISSLNIKSKILKKYYTIFHKQFQILGVYNLSQRFNLWVQRCMIFNTPRWGILPFFIKAPQIIHNVYPLSLHIGVNYDNYVKSKDILQFSTLCTWFTTIRMHVFLTMNIDSNIGTCTYLGCSFLLRGIYIFYHKMNKVCLQGNSWGELWKQLS